MEHLRIHEIVELITEGKVTANEIRRFLNSFPDRLNDLFEALDLLHITSGVGRGYNVYCEVLDMWRDSNGIVVDLDHIRQRCFNALPPEEHEEYLKTKEINERIEKQSLRISNTTNLNPKPQQSTPKPTRGRGRPKETFKDKMIDDADGCKLQKIHTIINGKKGKDAALIILACIKKGWLTKPTHTQVKNEFGDIGTKAGYNRYLNENMFTKEELDGVINSLD